MRLERVPDLAGDASTRCGGEVADAVGRARVEVRGQRLKVAVPCGHDERSLLLGRVAPFRGQIGAIEITSDCLVHLSGLNRLFRATRVSDSLAVPDLPGFFGQKGYMGYYDVTQCDW